MRSGVYVIGRAVGPFEYRSVTSKAGKPMAFVTGKVLAGQQFVTVSEKVEPGAKIDLPEDGDELILPVQPNFKNNQVIVVDVIIPKSRITAVDTAKK